MAKVHIAVPNQSWLHKYVTVSLLKMEAQKFGHTLSFNFQSEKPVDNNRNTMIRDMLLSDAGYEYLVFIDADNPPMRNPLELVDLDLDIVACPTPIYYGKLAARRKGHNPIIWNCMDYVEEKGGWTEHAEKEGLQEVDAAGTGCVIIARRVLEKVKPAFERVWHKEWGTVEIGSDLYFCQKAKDAGFRVWAHYDYPCNHLKERELVELHELLRARDVGYLNVDNPNTPEYWDEQWSKRKERKLPFYDLIVEMVNGDKVLDFGCGRGDLLALLGPKAVGMDYSEKAIGIVQERGLQGVVGEAPVGQWDTIVCTEVLEHLDDDKEMLEKFFEHTDRVIYSVPNNCLPPGLEPEHRRVYTANYVKKITPHLRKILSTEDYIIVLAEKEA